jgi:hypothetical protein
VVIESDRIERGTLSIRKCAEASLVLSTSPRIAASLTVQAWRGIYASGNKDFNTWQTISENGWLLRRCSPQAGQKEDG